MSLKVGVMQVSIYIQGATSLKEKRMVIKSIKDKISHRFNVSIDEVDYLDKWQRSVLAIAQVGHDLGAIERNMNQIYQVLLQNYSIQVLDKVVEFF